MDNFSVGEAGGIFAGAVALLAVLGKGLAWLLNWQGERSDRKAERLRLWEESLDRREKDAREKAAARHLETLARLEASEAGQQALGLAVMKLMRRVNGMRNSLREVTEELRLHAPDSLAAARAEQQLREAFRADDELPEDLAELARLLDDEEEDGR